MCLRLGTVVISLQTAVQKAIFSTQPRHSTKRVSWSRVPVQSSRLQLSTVHVGVYMELSPAELRSLDVTGRFTSAH